MTKGTGSLTTLRGHLGTPFEPELALKAEGGDVLRSINGKKHYAIISYSSYFLTLANHVYENDDVKGEER